MIRRLLSLAGAVFADAIRRKIVLVVGLFAVIMAAAIPSLPNYGLGVAGGTFREVALALTYTGALVITLTLAANRIPGEIERRTLYNVVARPVRRPEYLVGTWLGIVVVLGAVVAGFTVVEQALAWLNYHDPMWRLWEGAIAIWMEMGVVAALAVAVSSLAGPVVVVVSSIAMLFIGHSRDTIVAAVGSPVLTALYPSLEMFNVINPVAHGVGYDAAYAVGMVLSFAGWCAALLLAGSLAFSRRDL